MIGLTRAGDATMTAHRLPGRYINFVSEDDDDSVREAMGAETYRRLTEVKAKYDPDGIFSRNPNKFSVGRSQRGASRT